MRTSSRQDHDYCAFFLAYGRQPRNISEQDEFIYDKEFNEEEIIPGRIEDIIIMNLNIIPQAKNNIMQYKVNMIDRSIQ